MSNLAHQIQALLFALGRPLSRTDLQKQLGTNAADIDAALAELVGQREGVVVVDDGGEVELRVSGESAALVERVRKEEYSRDIGKAGLEALSAILYRGPLSRSEIDFIRGVNSSQTLRTLALRGLVRKVPNPKDSRSYLYEATTELMAQLGVTHRQELPDFAEVRGKLEALEAAFRRESQDKAHA